MQPSLPSVLLLAGVLLAAAPAAAMHEKSADAADATLNAFLDRAFDARTALSPQQQTGAGIRAPQDRLDDFTPEAQRRRLDLMRAQLATMRQSFRPDTLGPQGRISFELFERGVATAEDNAPWEDHRYLFSVLGSPATDVPAFLVNSHRIADVADAEAYIARLRDIERVMAQVAQNEKRRVAKRLTEPAFVFEPAIESARAQIRGAPFDQGPDSVLWADFKSKLDKLEIAKRDRERLLAGARDALAGPVARGYTALIGELEAASREATGNDGVWRLPGGRGYYANRIRYYTGTDMSPDAIHAIGLREMDRIHAEMRALLRTMGFKGRLQKFFSKAATDPQFRYPDDDSGRAAYLAAMQRTIDDAAARAPDFFSRKPRAPLEVRPLETWRAAGAPAAFYSPGGPDGSRPAIFYVNQSNMTQVLKLQSAAIACHEGIPGHHFEASFALEMPQLPKFRRFGAGYIAFGEGWGLYSEQLCREMGVYRNPQDRLGQLSLDALRAARLVVDTGIHARRWTRERARAYMRANTLLSDADIDREVDRYLCLPGQALSYKIGQIKILALRQKAEKALGQAFDIRAFHDAVLSGGGVPLDLLERQVDAYIEAARARNLSRPGTKARS